MSLRLNITVISGLFYAMTLHAAPLVSPLDRVQWQYRGDPFVCQLTTEVETFGSVSLIKPAGHPLQVGISSVIYNGSIKHYQLGVSAAPWSRKVIPESRWFHPPQLFSQSLSAQAPQLLQQLRQGMWGHVNLEYADGEQIHLVLPTVNSGEAFDEFYQCVTELAPYSYAQVRDRNFYFGAGEYLLTSQQQAEMARIARYISMDPKVSKILIDGHADRSGSLMTNLRLSQQRADDLYTYLLEAGVPADLIEVRSHGDRYPLVADATASERRKNRRVNLRIIRSKGN